MSTEQELALNTPSGPTLLSVGVFDGVHRGHLSLVETLLRRAQQRGLLGGIVTFSPHPQSVLHPTERTPLLASLEERVRLLHEAGVRLVVPLTFTRALSEYRPEQFVGLLAQYLKMSGLMLGPDFSLGKDRAGTMRTLEELGPRMGFDVEEVPPFTIDGEVVSSTAIRQALADGDIPTATRLLGRNFGVTAAVVSTSRRGESLGFPTANLDVDTDRALPRNGVYATIAYLHGGRYASVTNIGHRPTFGETELILETHILDFSGSVYGETLTVEFATRLRDEVAFQSPDQLVGQIRRDVEAARQILRMK
jgi:riboflavin kinase/FMN adenylyltransferase